MAAQRLNSSEKNSRPGAKKTNAGGRNKNSSQRKTSNKSGVAKNTKSKTNTGNRNSKQSNSGKSGVEERNRRRPDRTKQEQAIINDVKLIAGIAVVVFLTLSNFSMFGWFGNISSDIMFGLFGIFAYVFPIAFFVSVLFFKANVSSRNAMVKLAAAVVMFLMLGVLAQLIVSGNGSGIPSTNYYTLSAKNHNGGGLTGGGLALLLCKALGLYGAYLVSIAILLITIVILSGKAFLSAIGNKSKDMYGYARDDFERMREDSAKRLREKEERKARRKQNSPANMERAKNTVRGVTLSKMQDDSYQDSDMHEINQNTIFRGHVEIGNVPDKTTSNEISSDKTVFNEKTINETAINETINGEKALNRAALYNMPVNEGINKFEENSDVTEIFVNESGGRLKDSSEYGARFVADLKENTNTGYNGVKSNSDFGYISEFEKDEPDEETILNGEFKPKERIIVSEQAKAEMARKAFNVEPIRRPVKELSNQRIAPVEGITDVENNKSAAEAHGQQNGGSYNADLDSNLNIKKTQANQGYVMPPIELLKKGKSNKRIENKGIGLSKTAAKLQETLNAFGVKASVVDESRGPSVTRYELQPETGTKVSKITSLADDIKLNLAASDIRIEAPIPGKAAVGIEVPNEVRESVFLRELIESDELSKNPSKIAFAAGKDIAGNVVVGDIAKMPHMLIAGTTGSGKSVFTNSIIMSILFRAKPSEVKMIIVDPKVVEFGVYNGIPHLMAPVVTDPKKAAGALNWAVKEMSDRYSLFAKYNVRDLKGYNQKIKEMNYKDGDEILENKPQIVIIIDELADLMMVAAKDVEASICRLAQLARAAGIHLIIATQRPSVDVVTGLIKANIPSRVALLVSSGTDSRTIIDCNGGEKLLGNGDMLFYPSGYVKPVRLQGAFVSDKEVQDVVQFLVSNNQDVEYNDAVTAVEVGGAAEDGRQSPGSDDGRDVLFEEIGKFVIKKEKASTSMLQRMFKIGFNRASRIIDQLEEAGVIGPDEGTKPRKVLMTEEEFLEIL